MNISGVLLVIAGLLMFCGAVFDWTGVFRDYRVKPFVHLFGRQSARRFMGVAGFIAAVVGILIALNVIPTG